MTSWRNRRLVENDNVETVQKKRAKSQDCRQFNLSSYPRLQKPNFGLLIVSRKAVYEHRP